MAELVIYHRVPSDPHEYVACVDGVWLAWPAEQYGWTQRRRLATAPDMRTLHRLPADLAEFAVRASGVDV